MIDVKIVGPDGESARVTPSGELVVQQIVPSIPLSVTLDAVDTAFNFVKPVSRREYLVTDILLATNKDVGVDGATIVLYEAEQEDSTTAAKVIVSIQLLKNGQLPLTGLKWRVREGFYLNMKTNDDVVFATVACYPYVATDTDPANLGIGAAL